MPRAAKVTTMAASRKFVGPSFRCARKRYGYTTYSCRMSQTNHHDGEMWKNVPGSARMPVRLSIVRSPAKLSRLPGTKSAPASTTKCIAM